MSVKIEQSRICYSLLGKNQFNFEKKDYFNQEDFKKMFTGPTKVMESASMNYCSKDILYCPMIPFEKEADLAFLRAYKELLDILVNVFGYTIYPIFEKKTIEKLTPKYLDIITEFASISGGIIECSGSDKKLQFCDKEFKGKSYRLDTENKSSSFTVEVISMVFYSSKDQPSFKKLSENLSKEIKQYFPRVLYDTTPMGPEKSLVMSSNKIYFLFLKIQSELQYYIYREIYSITQFLSKNNFAFFPVVDRSAAPNQVYMPYDSEAITLKEEDPKWFDPFKKTLIKVLQPKIPTQMIKFCTRTGVDPKTPSKTKEKLKKVLKERIKKEFDLIYLGYNIYEDDVEEIKPPKHDEIFAPIFYVTQKDQIPIIEAIQAILVELQRLHPYYKFCLTICCEKEIFDQSKYQIDRVANIVVIWSTKTDDIAFFENKNVKKYLKGEEKQVEYLSDPRIVYFCSKELNKDETRNNIFKCITQSFKLPAFKQEESEKLDKINFHWSNEDKDICFTEKNNVFYFVAKVNDANLMLFKTFLRGYSLLSLYNYQVYPIAVANENIESKLQNNYRCFVIQKGLIIPMGYELVKDKKKSFLEVLGFGGKKEPKRDSNEIDRRMSFIEYDKKYVFNTFATADTKTSTTSTSSEPDVPFQRSGSLTERVLAESRSELFVDDVKFNFTKYKSLIIADYDLSFVDDAMRRVLNKYDLKFDKKVNLYNFDMNILGEYDIVMLFLHQKGRFNEVTIEKAKGVAKKFTKDMIYVVYFHLENIGFDPLDLVNSKNDVIYSLHVNYETKGENMDSQITYKLNADNYKTFENFLKETLDQ